MDQSSILASLVDLLGFFPGTSGHFFSSTWRLADARVNALGAPLGPLGATEGPKDAREAPNENEL